MSLIDGASLPNASTNPITTYQELKNRLSGERQTWLITGVAGFIGSNLLETLLNLNQRVVGLDNLETGYQHNLDEVERLVKKEAWENFRFIEGDIRKLEDCQRACEGVDHVLHQAALGSVPRSLANPIATNETNISGFLNMLVASRDQQVASFTYAASSSTYGDHPGLPKIEHVIGKPLSPYAVTKYVNELYAEVFSRSYGFDSIGLRYFNVFGKRQNPNGAYAAVIPKWISALLKKEPVYINGDGESSRDFCYIENVMQANLLAAMTDSKEVKNNIYNVAVGDRTTLKNLFKILQDGLIEIGIKTVQQPLFRNFRAGDVLHSHANVDKAKKNLGYCPTHRIEEGIAVALSWYVEKERSNADAK